MRRGWRTVAADPVSGYTEYEFDDGRRVLTVATSPADLLVGDGQFSHASWCARRRSYAAATATPVAGTFATADDAKRAVA
jgi:hypothetical protein